MPFPTAHALLTDAAATRDGILAALDTLAVRVGEDDTVFVFYAGHGEYGDDGYYLTTHDTQLVGRKVTVGSGIPRGRADRETAGHSRETAAPDRQRLPRWRALAGAGPRRGATDRCAAAARCYRRAARHRRGPSDHQRLPRAAVCLHRPRPADALHPGAGRWPAGQGVGSNHGYISVFDLYTHLYFALEDAVPRLVPAAVRQRYGEKQEPELTILKDVEPFAVALYRGATTRGAFDASGSLPEGTAVRAVNPAYAGYAAPASANHRRQRPGRRGDCRGCPG